MAPNTNPHHARICDDGLGRITVYWDNMDNPVIQLTDSSYIGGANRYVGVHSSSTVDAWIDNVRVYGDAAPLAVTDLAATSADWFQINLSWTAPWDLPPGPASSYMQPVGYCRARTTERQEALGEIGTRSGRPARGPRPDGQRGRVWREPRQCNQ